MIILKEITEQDGGNLYHFVRLRSDGVELDSLNVTVAADGVIRSMEILHNIEGDAAFSSTGRLLHCTAWESEAEAQAASFWSKHYTTRVGTWQGEIMDGLRIFGNLRRSIHDTYLKHLLANFPTRQSSIVFDTELYTVYEPTPLAAKPAEEDVDVPHAPISQADGFFRKNRRMLISLIIIIVSLTSIFLFLLTRPPELPPLSREMQSMTEARLLPAIPLVQMGYEAAFGEYTATTAAKLEAFAEQGAEIEFTDTDTFLDALYPLEKRNQLATFHDRVNQNRKLSDRQKADILHRLYGDNLTHTVVLGQDGFIPFAYNSLKQQIHSEALITYAYYLNRHFPGRAVAAEARFILANLVDRQKRLAELIFHHPAVSAACKDKNFAWLSHPNEAITVCATYERYSKFTKFEPATLRKHFNFCTLKLLDSILVPGQDFYRKSDAIFTRALLQIEITTEAREIQKGLNIIQGLASKKKDEDFSLREPFSDFLRILKERESAVAILGEIAAAETRIARVLSEIKSHQKYIDQNTRSITIIKSIEEDAWAKWQRTHLEKSSARAEKLSKRLPK